MQRKIGVVVPCANPAVEPEIHKLAPSSYFPYIARFPNYPDLDMKERLTKYRSDLPEAINTLKGLDLDGVLVACTGSSYPAQGSYELHYLFRNTGRRCAENAVANGSFYGRIGTVIFSDHTSTLFPW